MIKLLGGDLCKAFWNLSSNYLARLLYSTALSRATLSGTTCILIAVSVPETYGPLRLKRRAQALSKLTGQTMFLN